MSAALLALALLGAAPSLPCDEQESRVLELEALSAEPAAFDAALARLGDFASLPSETSEKVEVRAKLAAGRLALACRLAGRQEGVAPGDPDRERLKAILDRPEFSGARRRNSHLLERWFARLQGWLVSLLETSQAQSFSEASRGVVLAVALAVVVGGALRLLSRRRRRSRPGPLALVPAGRLDLRDPAEHLGLAKAALGADPREAIRQGLLSLLSALERRRLARPDRVKTNRELAAELPGRGAPAALCLEVERLLLWYDRAFYSLEPVAAPAAHGFLDEVSRLQASLPGGER